MQLPKINFATIFGRFCPQWELLSPLQPHTTRPHSLHASLFGEFLFAATSQAVCGAAEKLLTDFIFGLAIGSWATILFSKASMACQLPTWEIFVIYITIYWHLLLAFFVPTLSLSLSSLSASPLLISTLVIELDVAEFHLSLA